MLLLSGGKGTRLKSSLPKQYLKIFEKEIARYSFELFYKSSLIDQIIVVCEEEFENIFNKDLEAKGSSKVLFFARPGTERQDSLKNALKVLEREIHSSPDSFVLVHDAARPCLEMRDLRRVVAAAKEYGAALLASPIVATLKKADQQQFVLNSPKREDMWLAQTPQVMKRRDLEEAIKEFPDLLVTDDCSYIEALKKPVKIVPATAKNFKITQLEDLALAEFYLKGMQ